MAVLSLGPDTYHLPLYLCLASFLPESSLRQGLFSRDLNRHGLHEDLFGHFVQNLLEACQPYQLSVEQDYRRLLVRYSMCLVCLGA